MIKNRIGYLNNNKWQHNILIVFSILVSSTFVFSQSVTKLNFDSLEVITPGANGIPLPKVVVANKPTIRPYKLASTVAGNPKIVKVNPDNLIINTPGKGKFILPKVKLLPDSGFLVQNKDTIYSPIKSIPLRPKVIPAQEFRYKDNAVYDIQFIDVDQGLPNSHFHDIVIDKAGNLWLGSYKGELIRYDGTSYTVYGEEQGLNCNSIRTLLFDEEGVLWIGTNGGGLINFDGKIFTSFNEDSGFSDQNILSIFEDSKGGFWIGTNTEGILYYNGTSITSFSTKEGLSGNDVKAIIEDEKGNIWVGTESGISCYNGRKFINYTTSNGLIDNSINSILVKKNGEIWFGTNGGISIFINDTFTSYSQKEGLSYNIVNELYEDKKGIIWIGTEGGGINKFDGKSFNYISVDEGLTNNNIKSIIKDNSNNIWIATYGGGICRFNQNSFTHLTKQLGSVESIVLSIIEDRKGDLWMGSYTDGVSIFDGKSFTNYNNISGATNVPIWSLLEDAKGNIWLGTNNGLSKFDGVSFTNYTNENGLVNNSVFSIVEDSKGNIWLGTYNGVSKFDGHSFTNFTAEHGLANKIVFSITEDNNDDIWFGTFGGISKYNGKSITTYTKTNGLLNDRVRNIYEDKSGNLWLGTDEGAMSFQINHLKSNVLTIDSITTQNGLPHKGTLSIIEDNRNRLWIGTDGGIACLFNSSAGKEIYSFKQLDGLLNGLDAVQNSVCLSSDDKIWWGMGKGVTILDVNNFNVPNNIPVVQLNEVYINDEPLNFRSDELSNKSFSEIEHLGVKPFYNYPTNLKIPHDLNHLTFYFSAIDWSAPHKIKYQYKLEGLDEDWSSLTKGSKAEYRNLPDGTFSFKLKAIGSANKWSDTFEYTFTVHPPWWLTWWAYAIYGISVVVIILLIVKINSFRLKQQNLQLEHAVAQRTAELKTSNKKLIELDKFKEGLTGMIVHDLKNPLNGIINISKSYSVDEQIHRMRQIGKQILNMVENILDVHKYEETKMNLNTIDISLFNLSQVAINEVGFLANEKSIVIKNTVPLDIVVRADKEIVERIFVNILTNAIKYTPNNGIIQLTAVINPKNNSKAYIEIVDSGQGIPESELNKIFDKFGQISAKKSGVIRSTGLGLTFCKMAVEAHECAIGVESKLKMGATFWFTLPISTNKVEERSNEVKRSTQAIDNAATSLLTENDKQLLKPFVLEFKKHGVYKISILRKLLKQINTDDNERIVIWKNTLEKLINSGNEEGYSKLINKTLK